MQLRTLALVAPLALGVGLAACDSRDYEAEIATLQEDLEAAQTELETAQTENEELTAQLEELQGQGGGLGEEAAAQVQTELNAIVESASLALADLTQLSAQAPDADVSGLRENFNQIIESAQATAEQVGVQVQAPEQGQQGGAGAAAEGEQQGGEQVEPAAGPADQQEQGQQQQPAQGEQPAPAAGPTGQQGEQEPAATEQPEGEQQEQQQ